MSSRSQGTNEDPGQLWWLQLWLDVLLSVVLHGAGYGLGYLGGQSSDTDGYLAPQEGKIWKAEWCDASPEHYRLIEHIWEHMGSLWKGRVRLGSVLA